tara:strand:+ start:1774 stop:2904 length:1131 start_codon:yes stop_codon:yes gene_type:complete
MKIAYTFLTDEIQLSEEKNFDSFYKKIGLNTGNFLFANACKNLIKGEAKTGVGTNFEANHVNKNFDALVIPAANWINNYSDWTPLIKSLKKLKIPLLVLGLGVQASSYDKKDLKINKSSKELLKVIADKSELISLRGFFTKKCCEDLGIKNTVVTGCPSAFVSIDVKDIDPSNELVIASTRYYADRNFMNNFDINSFMYRFAFNNRADIYFQSEPEEMQLLVKPNESLFDKNIKNLAKVYNASQKEVKNYVQKCGAVHTSINDWAEYLKSYKKHLTTRIHGAILGNKIGTPTTLIVHDSRTLELADSMGVHFVNGLDVYKAYENNKLNSLFLSKAKQINNFNKQRNQNYKLFHHLVKTCGLEVDNSQVEKVLLKAK